MKLILPLIVGAVLSCCVGLPSNPEKQLEWKTNSCLPTAITMRHGLRNSTKWNEILLYEYLETASGTVKGHAVCVYIYPVGSNKMYAYDYEGSTRIRAHIDNPAKIAELTEQTRFRADSQILKAYFLDASQDWQ